LNVVVLVNMFRVLASRVRELGNVGFVMSMSEILILFLETRRYISLTVMME